MKRRGVGQQLPLGLPATSAELAIARARLQKVRNDLLAKAAVSQAALAAADQPTDLRPPDCQRGDLKPS